MYHESIVVRNLAVLKALKEGHGDLGDIAKAAGYRASQVTRSLQQLVQDGVVQEDGGAYQLPKNATVFAALDLVLPWLNAQQESFYEIARDVAKIIHTRSWSEAHVEGVLLYGSTLRSTKPRDIDMVILHSGNQLAGFEFSRYADEGMKPISDLPAGDPKTSRLPAFYAFLRLGYSNNGSVEDRAVRYIGERIANLDAGSVPEEQIARAMRTYETTEEGVGSHYDIHGTSTVFDVHTLHVGLLGDQVATERLVAGLRSQLGDEWATRRMSEESERYTRARRDLIYSCTDPTFWHRVLSEGKIYDFATADFSLTVEDKFPGALALFEVPRQAPQPSGSIISGTD